MGAPDRDVLKPSDWVPSKTLVELAIELHHQHYPEAAFGVTTATDAVRDAVTTVLRRMCEAVRRGEHSPCDSRTALTNHGRLHCQFVTQFQNGAYSYLYPRERKGEQFMTELHRDLEQQVLTRKKIIPVSANRGNKVLLLGAVASEDGEMFLKIFATPQEAKR